MRWSRWLAHFEKNRRRPLPPISDLPIDGAVKKRVARSLAVFQRGETGEGRISKEIYEVELDGIDDDYRRSLGLFVAEEGRHARILGEAVRALGGEVLSDTWTDRLFVRGRRLAGIRMKLLVLCVAEVVGIVFYAMIAAALSESRLRAALEQIVGDEEHHLRFHADFFRTQVTTPFRALLFRVLWWLVGIAACWVVLIDHRRTLRSLGVPLAQAHSRFVQLLQEVSCIRSSSARVPSLGTSPES